MKSKKLNLEYVSQERKELFIYFFASAGLIVFIAEFFNYLYLHNPNFHMFVQSKGIFL